MCELQLAFTVIVNLPETLMSLRKGRVCFCLIELGALGGCVSICLYSTYLLHVIITKDAARRNVFALASQTS